MPNNIQTAQNIIETTYFDRFDEMTLEYQLHFASRLYAWTGNKTAAKKLHNIKPLVVPSTHELRVKNLHSIRQELLEKDYERDVNDYARRKVFFDKYPELLLVHNALFRIRHWYCIFGVDERSALYEIIPKKQLQKLLHELYQDTEAMKTLSTYAINTLYLHEALYGPDENVEIDPAFIMNLAKLYDATNPVDMQILFYLYTHCILGESLFYYQPVRRHLDAYCAMLKELEVFIGTHFSQINLDNKFEFLVCAKICGFTSAHIDRIYEEACASLNDEGFIVDVMNKNINPKKQSFMMSEHRNVLFLMSSSNPRYIHSAIA